MTDFLTLATAIASQLDGTIRPSGDGADDAPFSTNEIVWIDLANEREGLRVVLRRGHGAEATRLRATMSQSMASRNGADYREAPAFYEMTTAAALSRGPRVIAAQIESKIVQPAVPMLEAWKDRAALKAAAAVRLEEAAARWREAFPLAHIKIKPNDTEGTFHLTGGGTDPDAYWYVNARFNENGLYVDRMSRLPEAAAVALLNAMPKA
jgi:hypothetical protein